MKFAPGTTDSTTGKPYFYVSDCGNFTVGIPFGAATHYNAWRIVRDEQGKRRGATPLGNYPSAKAAKQACEDNHVANP